MKTNYKVGQTLFHADCDEVTGKVEMDEWVIRTIKKRNRLDVRKRAHAVMKCSITYGKLSKSHGDFGWLPNIPEWLKRSWTIGLSEPWGLSTTKRAALLEAVKEVKRGTHSDDAEINEKFLRTLKGQITRLKGGKP